ncbi:hypothetical protein [Prosthecobacter sp.]|uniref:hypothetical protein n=1 Tax=Prosthecobacter sp. TaxID=1965333 RepID=UPI003782D2D5
MKAFLEAWLIAWLFWSGLAFGALANRLLQALTGGAWAQAVRAPCEAAALTLPLLGVLFLPIAFGAETLYPWGDRALFATHDWPHKAAYFTLSFFNVRSALTLGIGALLTFLVLRSDRREAALGAGGLIAFFLCMNFSATDWALSLTPEFSSSIFPTILMFFQFVAAHAFVVLTACRTNAETLTAKQCHDLGNLLLAFLIFWAYVSFSQFLLVWSGNLPREISWYLPRWSGGWEWLALLLVLGKFALPLALLLSKAAKSDPRRLARIAAIVLAASVLEIFWLVAPALHPRTLALPWQLPLTFIIIGSLWLFLFRRLLSSRKEAAHA